MEKKISKEISVRTIDELGRVVLPAEIRHKLNLSTNDKVKIIEKGDKIVIGKYIAIQKSRLHLASGFFAIK